MRPTAPTSLSSGAVTTSAEPPPEPLKVDFVGRRGALFGLALKTGVLTILTLGIYRFWMKTRMRRWYWSAIRPGGHPMEYVGDPWEKLLGFFIAVVILTFYIGIVNLVLMFVSFSVFAVSWVGYVASVAGVIPLWFYASYRARRYVLGRTRWRGVRFGLEPGAWGYAWRALCHWAVTICSIGLLWPRMTFWLEKYRTDRTYFGSVKLHQGGHWTMLYGAAKPLGFVLILTVIWALWIWLDPIVPFGQEGLTASLNWLGDMVSGTAETLFQLNGAWRLSFLPVLLVGLIYGALHYWHASRRILAQHKTADGIRIGSLLRAPRMAGIYMFGSALAYVMLMIGLFVVILAIGAALGFDAILGISNPGSGLHRPVLFTITLMMYFGVFLMWSVMLNTFVTFPAMRHAAETTTLIEHAGLSAISQRARDEFAEAEGFAEALDLGAAI